MQNPLDLLPLLLLLTAVSEHYPHQPLIEAHATPSAKPAIPFAFTEKTLWQNPKFPKCYLWEQPKTPQTPMALKNIMQRGLSKRSKKGKNQYSVTRTSNFNTIKRRSKPRKN